MHWQMMLCGTTEEMFQNTEGMGKMDQTEDALVETLAQLFLVELSCWKKLSLSCASSVLQYSQNSLSYFWDATVIIADAK